MDVPFISLSVDGQLPAKVQESPVSQVEVEVQQLQSRKDLHDALVRGAEEEAVRAVPAAGVLRVRNNHTLHTNIWGNAPSVPMDHLPGPHRHDQGVDPPVRQAAPEEVPAPPLVGPQASDLVDLPYDVPDQRVEAVVPGAVVPGGQCLHGQEEGDGLVGQSVLEAGLEAPAEGGQVGVAVRDLAGVLCCDSGCGGWVEEEE